MFDKLQKGKQLLQMRSQAKELQRKMAEVTESVDKGNIKVKVTGDQRVEYIELDGESRDDLARVINEAFKKVQKKAAQKMLQDGGLKGLFGNN